PPPALPPRRGGAAGAGAMKRTLIAGVGNIFFGDDGFGCAVARRLAAEPLPGGVRAVDFGVRGIHLAYELASGWERAIGVDAGARGGVPGTLYVIDPHADAPSAETADAHGLDLGAVLALAETLGAQARVTVVGCEAGDAGERIGLGVAVERAVEAAAA